MSPTSLLWAADGPRAKFDREGKVSGWDPAFEFLWGRSAAEALGRSIEQILIPLEPAALPDLESVLRAGGWSGIVALVPTTGIAPRPTGIQLSAASGLDGLELWLAPLSCLTQADVRGDAPIEPERDLQRFAAILECLPGYCYTVDRDLVFTSSAGKGLAVLNLQPGQVIGMSLLDLWGTREGSYEPLRCHLKALAGIASSYKDVCLGRSMEHRVTPQRDRLGNVVGAIGVAIDVTDTERARDELGRLTAQLRQAQKTEAIGQLAGGIAHDFNNFLTCIAGNLGLLEPHVEGDSQAEAYLREVEATVDSAASLSSQLLAFGRKQALSPRPLQLGALVERMRKLLERLAGERIRLRVEADRDLGHVKADPGQLEQVLVNLVSNARDAISVQGEIAIETRSVREGGQQYVALTVSDTGRGLSDVVRARLFEPFFTTKELGQGTGLGLATVHAAVHENGGTISVDSELGKGTTFRILLPCVEAVPEARDDGRARRSAQMVGGTETILLVEDEAAVLELAHRTLQQLGYNVLPCAGPEEALRVFGQYQSRVALLVTDVAMPRMDGKELAERISALSPGVSVLFSSGYGEDIVASDGALEDGVHFIAKPYRPRELAAKVRELLDQRRA